MNTQTLKPSDLRIGNHYNWRGGDAPDGGYDIVFEIKDFVDFEKHPYRFRRIPLTEEWLLKFGFYKSIENAGNLECYKKGSITVAKWINNKWQVWIDSKDLRKSPQYIHQLQDLYHALTGEELEIKI